MAEKYFALYMLVFFGTFFSTVAVERFLIPRLKKCASQPIYTEGPSWHEKKQGTPTMGGLGFCFSISAFLIACSILLYLQNSKDEAMGIIISALYALANALVGVMDDLKKLKRNKNAGLTPKQKLALQLILAIAFLFARKVLLLDGSEISFSFGEIDLGIFYYPISLIALLGTVNCANLTDGIDGLATSVALCSGVAILFISASLFKDAAICACAIMGGCAAFLIFNANPAKIFMGDTGSLFLGALISACVFTVGNPLLIIFICAVYLIEGISVILQVISYKLTGKRVFLMAPLHHHLEKRGITENQICLIAIIITLLCSCLGFIIFMPIK